MKNLITLVLVATLAACSPQGTPQSSAQCHCPKCDCSTGCCKKCAKAHGECLCHSADGQKAQCHQG